jgi:toxin HigB-1
MIKGFAHKGLKQLFEKGTKKGVVPHHAPKLLDIMDRLDASEIVDDMQYPGSDLHPLSGKLKDHWAVAVTGNYRLTFKFENGDAFIVDYQDYH